jgi:hypothetical protein
MVLIRIYNCSNHPQSQSQLQQQISLWEGLGWLDLQDSYTDFPQHLTSLFSMLLSQFYQRLIEEYLETPQPTTGSSRIKKLQQTRRP